MPADPTDRENLDKETADRSTPFRPGIPVDMGGRLLRPGGPAAKRQPSPEGLGHNATTRRSAVGAALDS